MIRIFLSYSGQDSLRVKGVERFFEQGGQIKCWNFEHNSNYLRDIPSDIATAVEESDYFFLFWSSSVANRIAWVENEYLIANEIEKNLRNTGKLNAFIRIILLDNTPLPREMGGKRNIRFTENDFTKLKDAILSAGPRPKAWDVPPQVNPLSQSVTTIMTPEPLAIPLGNTRLVDAFIYMEAADVRHLTVLNDDGSLAGFISHRDIRKKIPPKLHDMKKVQEITDVGQYQRTIRDAGQLPIAAVMTPFNRLVYLTDNATIEQALDALLRVYDFGRISALPIIHQSQAVGIVSYVDILCKLNIPDITVKEAKKSEQLFQAKIIDTVGDVDLLMKQVGIRHMPIEDDDNNLCGMIDDVTILWLMHAAFNLPKHPVKEFMKPIENISYLRDENRLIDAVNSLFCIDKNITALPVVDDATGFCKLTGMLSYIDILEKIKYSTSRTN